MLSNLTLRNLALSLPRNNEQHAPHMEQGKWTRVGSGLVWAVPEDSVSLVVARQWKRLLKAENDLAHAANEYRRGAEWATSEVLQAAREELTRASDNWRSLCRAMGWKGRNGRTFPVHLTPAPTPEP